MECPLQFAILKVEPQVAHIRPLLANVGLKTGYSGRQLLNLLLTFNLETCSFNPFIFNFLPGNMGG
jgi:hypothetical protein